MLPSRLAGLQRVRSEDDDGKRRKPKGGLNTWPLFSVLDNLRRLETTLTEFDFLSAAVPRQKRTDMIRVMHEHVRDTLKQDVTREAETSARLIMADFEIASKIASNPQGMYNLSDSARRAFNDRFPGGKLNVGSQYLDIALADEHPRYALLLKDVILACTKLQRYIAIETFVQKANDAGWTEERVTRLYEQCSARDALPRAVADAAAVADAPRAGPPPASPNLMALEEGVIEDDDEPVSNQRVASLERQLAEIKEMIRNGGGFAPPPAYPHA